MKPEKTVLQTVSIKVVAEGSTPEQRARREWGLSLLVGGTVLFDTFGHPGIFKKNMKKFGVNPRDISSVIISHGHWDHVAGLKTILSNNHRCAVYMPQNIKEIADLCRDYGITPVIAAVPEKIGAHMFITGGMNAGLNGAVFQEQAMIVKGKKGYVLVAGCSHPGIVKMIKLAKKITGDDIYAVMGGLHLKDTPAREIRVTAFMIKKLGVKMIVGGHCTGKNASDTLKKIFGPGFKPVKEGKTYVF